MCSIEEFEEIFQQFHEIYDEFSTKVMIGIEQETINEEAALKTYKDCIELIDKAMLMSVSFPSDEDLNEDVKQKIKDLKKIIYNFKMQRSEILLRIGTIFRRKDNEESQDIKKPKLNESKLRTRTYNELEDVLMNLSKLKHDETSNSHILEILFCCDAVKLYYIESNGDVVSSNGTDFVLRIIRLGSDFEKNLDETIFLQLIKTSETSIEVGEEVKEHPEPSTSADNSHVDPSFIYPLIPGVSPLFRTNFNAFVLPDLQSNDGSAIGMMVPTNYDDLVLDILVTILKGIVKENGEIEFGDFTKFSEESGRIKRSTTADKVSSGIVNGAYWLSSGIVKTAQATGSFIDYSTPYILSRVQSLEEQPVVSNKIQTSVTVAKSLSGYAAQGTNYLADKVGGAMTSFGKFLAPHVQKQGAKFLSYTGIEESNAEHTMIETLKIASGTAEAISTIYSGLETSASILGRNIADNSVKIVTHKYGESYGNTATCTFDTVGNLIAVNKSFNILTPKGLVKSTAKSAGKGILSADEFKPKAFLNKDYFTGSVTLYPNLDNLAKEMNSK